ncbi:MAG: glycosyltransferase [Proteobacteria bacterium]|nr:glycosyltransferase [Pseudomonadota bacterium]
MSTGETWDIWLAHPELVREVDYIAAHILPYWEGIPAEEAVKYAFERYQQLRAAYPGKRVVIAEFGWPSRGYNNKAAVAAPAVQAELIRAFVRQAADRDIPFNIIEAFDQPWKSNEGSVGAYWGLFDTDGNAKFPLVGDFREKYFYPRMILALAIGALIAMFCMIRVRATFAHALAFSAAANALAAGVAVAAHYPLENYLNVGSAIAWGVGMLLMVPLTAMTLVKVHEVADVTLGRRPFRLLRPPVRAAGFKLPMVSVHIPAYREKPKMLIETLDSVSRLNYPNFEVLVVVNNTPEEYFWRPIERHCQALGPRFKFINLPKVAGFKAGALNEGMKVMAPDAEIIALLDADYVVEPNWLKDLIPAFANPKIALVQAPQDHRDGEETILKAIMNSEYAGFFDIGMVQRNEHNAEIAHGTMLLIRRSAFEQVGGWATDTITEDAELGLRLFEAGYGAQYTNRRYGRGMLPDTLKAFMNQRQRWTFGAMQIIRKHWRHMWPGSTTLTQPQKTQFIIGWSYWLSDAFGVLAAVLNLLWVPMIVGVGVLIPMLPFTLPILVMFLVNLMHCIILYGVRVRISPKRIFCAAIAAMSLQMTVARAVAEGLWGIRLEFKRTEKGGLAKSAVAFPVKREAWLGTLLLVSSVVLVATNETQTVEINIFAATIVVQSLPFVAATGMAWLERHSRGRAEAEPTANLATPTVL